MNQLAICAGVAAVALLASSAQATTYLEATFTSPGAGSASWDQDYTPTPLTLANGIYTAVSVWNYTDSFGGVAPYVFYFSADAGGAWQDAAGDFSPTGVQVYGGSEAAPVFSAGSFAENDGTLTLTAVPEPSTWAMMLVGFGLVAAATRRRRSAIA